jgi:hypothetical protein
MMDTFSRVCSQDSLPTPLSLTSFYAANRWEDPMTFLIFIQKENCVNCWKRKDSLSVWVECITPIHDLVDDSMHICCHLWRYRLAFCFNEVPVLVMFLLQPVLSSFILFIGQCIVHRRGSNLRRDFEVRVL